MPLAYDANGNLTNDGSNSYTWDARNHLYSMTGASFVYDVLGRRVTKTIGGVSTRFLYDGMNPVQELSGATPTANLMTGLGIDEFLTRTDSAGTRSLLTEALGSSIALADNTGAIQTSYTYEPFGNVSITGTASSNTFQYTGRENDGTGLYYYRARYYNVQIDRFISEDPIGYSSGQMNLYEYVFDNPINLIDPSGLDALNWLQDLSDFSNGAASVLTFGITDRINNALGNSKYVNKCSGWYTLGTGTGIGLTIAIGGAAGAEAAEANAGTTGFEISHWIPTRFGGPKSIFNGNYVSQEFHYLTDPFRYPPGWQAWGPKLDPAFQQILRVPWVYQGATAGAAYGGASAMSGRNCGCN